MNNEFEQNDDFVGLDDNPQTENGDGDSTKGLDKRTIIGGAIIVALFAAVFLVMTYNQPQPEVVVEVDTRLPIISDEELAEERRALPLLTSDDIQNNANETVGENPVEAVDETDEQPTESSESAAPAASGGVTGFTPLDQISAEQLIPPQNNQSNSQQVGVTSNDDTVQMGEIVAVNSTHVGDMQPVSVTGVVRDIDIEAGVMVIANVGETPYLVHLTSDTEFIINNKGVRASGIRKRDVVQVQGQGYASSVQLNAETVTVIGELAPPELQESA